MTDTRPTSAVRRRWLATARPSDAASIRKATAGEGTGVTCGQNEGRSTPRFSLRGREPQGY